jgi:hypothetical protein
MIRAELDERTQGIPRSEEEKDQVRRQMHRLLSTAHFKNSRRYPALFRYIVEETLEGRGEFLKERLLGVQVFGRPPGYDTASDPIVRVTIAEIRKRIAQYYHEESHESEMRIELMPGRYEPEFFPGKPTAASTDAPSAPFALHAHTQVQPPERGTGALEKGASRPSIEFKDLFRAFLRSRRWLAAGSLCLVALAAATVLLWTRAHPSAIDQLWRPVLASQRTITLCIPSASDGFSIDRAAGIVASDRPAGQTPRQTTAHPPHPRLETFLAHENGGENVVYSDVLAANTLSGLIGAAHGESRLRLSSGTTLADLQQGPNILIGGLDNGWTLRALSQLRYRFAGNDQEQYWITDVKNPSSRAMQLDLNADYPAVKQDYAIIARVHDQSTGQIQMIVAGIGMCGTAAAGEYLANPAQVEQLRQRVGRGFRDHDFEAVLGMDVVNGQAGSPRVLAVYVW